MTLSLPAVWDRPPPEVVESTEAEPLHDPEPPRIPSVAPVRLRTGRRARLLREVLGEVEALRPVLHEAVEQYELRMTAQIAEILRALGGESDRFARMPTVKSSSAMWPFRWTRRSAYISMIAPRAPHRTGASTSAGQKPTIRLSE